MKQLIKNRISELRSIMQKNDLDAYIIWGTDPHMSEYVPAHWETRQYISGFTGSAGMAVITMEKAALWTDSRYFIQAEDQLAETGIDLIKMRTSGHPSIAEWIKSNLEIGDYVGTNEWCISTTQFNDLYDQLSKSHIFLKESGDLLDQIWSDRPPLPAFPIYEHKLQHIGAKRKEKINAIRTELKKTGATTQIITALDDIAWTFNLRGDDVEYNPVFLAYAIISETDTLLFINNKKFPEKLKTKLETEKIQVRRYTDITEYIQKLPRTAKIVIDPDKTSKAITKLIPKYCQILEGLSIPGRLKAIKTDSEIENIREAMRKDGVAFVEFLYWFESKLGKFPITEYNIAEKLTEYRAKQEEYKGLSFFPIVGYKEHGAIVHYKVPEKDSPIIRKDGFLLLDSGAHYSDGTTDVTRTLALSKLTKQQKTDYTAVLKGMIALSMTKFPINTRGYHLDILARKELWQLGLNYGHGTGHGVGYFLNVHEGPMSIRQEFNDQAIEAGMVLSNEPGLYRTGDYGIRTENMMVCVKDETSDYGEFLRFDTLTLCPIDTRAIDKNLMSAEETNWLNNYHQWVFDQLSPRLNDEVKEFLKGLTLPI